MTLFPGERQKAVAPIRDNAVVYSRKVGKVLTYEREKAKSVPTRAVL